MQCERLQGGLQKIADASEMLAVLNEKLAVQKVAVTEKTAACEVLLDEIARGTKAATEKKAFAEAKGEEIAEQSKIIEVEKVGFFFSLFYIKKAFTVKIKPLIVLKYIAYTKYPG